MSQPIFARVIAQKDTDARAHVRVVVTSRPPLGGPPPALPSQAPASAARETAAVLGARPAMPHTGTTAASTNDTALLSILDAPVAPGETLREGFLRKEAELRAAFVQLSVVAQRALYARLANPCAGDLLAERFARLTADRRTRLLTFLSDARRREALANVNIR